MSLYIQVENTAIIYVCILFKKDGEDIIVMGAVVSPGSS